MSTQPLSDSTMIPVGDEAGAAPIAVPEAQINALAKNADMRVSAGTGVVRMCISLQATGAAIHLTSLAAL